MRTEGLVERRLDSKTTRCRTPRSDNVETGGEEVHGEGDPGVDPEEGERGREGYHEEDTAGDVTSNSTKFFFLLSSRNEVRM